MPGLVHDPHAAPADLAEDFVVAHALGEGLRVGHRAGQGGLAVGGEGGVGQAVERPGGLLAPAAGFQVRGRAGQLRLRQVAQVEGDQFGVGQALAGGRHCGVLRRAPEVR